MLFFFADDSKQLRPTRAHLTSLVGIGGFSVAGDRLRCVESELDTLCVEAGFPRGEEFKWSPSRDHWMRNNLVREARSAFFESVLGTLRKHKATATVVATDTAYGTATGASTHELDVTRMFLERAHIVMNQSGGDGIVIVDRPGGGRRDEDAFLSSCVETIQMGTDYMRPERFALSVLTSPSQFARCLQAADIVAGCSLALIAGETNFAPLTFAHIKPMLRKNQHGFIGGTGLKVHPDARLRNLYYWLLGDDVYSRGNTGDPLPGPGLYETDDGLPNKNV